MYGDALGLSTDFADADAVNGTAKSSDFACYDAPTIMRGGIQDRPSNPDGLAARRASAVSSIGRHPRLVVALSGGVDSAALLALAVEALGAGNVVAVTGRSDAVTAEEIEDARAIAAALGVRHEVVATREMERPGYRENSGDRCFHCRTELFEILDEFARSEGIPVVAYGAIQDDLGEHRPGMDAARRHGVLAPLLDAGLSKIDVRAVAKAAGLHVSDKPANPCLASRIPAGTEVTPERLDQVRRAEAGLRALGLLVLRVRHHGEIARLELGDAESERLTSEAFRSRVVAAVRDAGFRFVVVDLEGYRPSGGRVRTMPPALYSIGPIREGGQ
jgi:pyridinium-3,5-biscarboxylic acid mononucleotide sulfurtransferase